MGFSIENLTGLTLGQQGENLVNTIRIDMTKWMDDVEDLQVYVLAIRNGELLPYMAATAMEENELVWPVTSADTDVQGIGLAQIIGTNGTTIRKSKTVRTIVGDAIPGSSEENAPVIYQNTADEFLTSLAAIRDATIAAKTAAETAQTAAETAQTGAESAQSAAVSAKNAAQGIANALNVDALTTKLETGTTASYIHHTGALFLVRSGQTYKLYQATTLIQPGTTINGKCQQTSIIDVINEMRGT